MGSARNILLSLDNYLSLGAHRLETVKSLVSWVISAGTVNLKEVCARFEHGVASSNYRKIQYFFQKQHLDDAEIICFIISHLFEEDTHLTHPERIKALVQICALAMSVSFIAVDYARVPYHSLKKHSFKLISAFTFARRFFLKIISQHYMPP